jgi:hypothetical protein
MIEALPSNARFGLVTYSGRFMIENCEVLLIFVFVLQIKLAFTILAAECHTYRTSLFRVCYFIHSFEIYKMP